MSLWMIFILATKPIQQGARSPVNDMAALFCAASKGHQSISVSGEIMINQLQ